MATKYFLYSAQQMEFRKQQESRMGKTFRVGHVFVSGARKPFTEMCSNPTNRFSDSKLVATGDPDEMSFILPSST